MFFRLQHGQITFQDQLFSICKRAAHTYMHKQPPHLPSCNGRIDKAHLKGYEYIYMAEDGGGDQDGEVWHHPPPLTMHGARTCSMSLLLYVHHTDTSQNRPPVISANLAARGSSAKRRNARDYLQALNIQADSIEQVVKISCPKTMFKQLKARDKACIAEHLRVVFFGVATNWKVDMQLHCNNSDNVYCATTCAGSFTGGEMLFPQLDLAFK
jgi:hypothetical protein